MNVGVFGLGYVGLVSGVILASKGNKVFGFELDEQRRNSLKEGHAGLYEPGLEEMYHTAFSEGLFQIVDGQPSKALDVIFICVGTPDDNGDVDLSQVAGCVGMIAQLVDFKTGYPVVVLKSTCPPGTTETLIVSELEKLTGSKMGEDFGVAMNPEFLRQGSALSDALNPDRIVLGTEDRRSLAVLQQLYSEFDCPKLCMSFRNAEMTKYVANSFFASLVSLANEFGSVFEQGEGFNEATIMDAVLHDRRFSSVGEERAGVVSYFRAGPGFGGSCFPKDLNALSAYLLGQGISAPLLTEVIKTNNNRSSQIMDNANRLFGSFLGKKVLVLGLGFKEGTADLRGSPGLRLIELLLKQGANVKGCDPLSDSPFGLTHFESLSEALSDGADTIFIVNSLSSGLVQELLDSCGESARYNIYDLRGTLDPEVLPVGINYAAVGTSIKR